MDKLTNKDMFYTWKERINDIIDEEQKKDIVFVTSEDDIVLDTISDNGLVLITDVELNNLKTTINKPEISTPANNSTILIRELTISSNTNFSYTSVITVTHQSTDYKITSDVGGTNIVLEENNSSDLMAHTFENLEFSSGVYYCFMRYRDNENNVSDWSNPVSFIYNGGGVISSGERLFYRHPSEMGTVMEYRDKNGYKKLLVLDCAYRSKSIAFGTYGVDNSLINYIANSGYSNGYIPKTDNLTDNALINYSTTDYINSGGVTTGATNYTYFEDDGSAKENCDIWMQSKDIDDTYSTPIHGVPAVEFCRNIKVNGVSCDLPNVQQMIRIWLEREMLTELDPTVSKNAGTKLSVSVYWHASTKYSAYYNWNVAYNGYVCARAKYNACYVCPVLELD